jgi:Uncharacterized protein conserved in bacteria (DUF2188)
VPSKADNTVAEYHVVRVQEPYPRWEVQYGGKRVGYKAWDQRVATSAAKELARKNKPSKVVIHDEQGQVQSEIVYEKRREKK